MVGGDLLLNAGLLAPLYDWGSPFLLSPDQAVVRIPVGYLSFLLLAITLVWLLARFDVVRGKDGAVLGGSLGGIVWGAILLGLWSISTASPTLLAGWWLGQTAELALGGFVIGSILGGARLRRIAALVVAFVMVAAISAVVLQSIGYAPAPVVVR